MKVKLFSHQADPDGMGCVVLAKLVYKVLEYTLCKNNEELDKALEEFVEQKGYLDFDQIVITDLCPKDDILKKIESIPDFGKKCKVFDHHKTSKEVLSKDYPFVTVEETIGNKKVCGTSLFYDFLKEQFPLLETSYIKGFVEHTRLHDTWEWKEAGNETAYHLETLFQYLGRYGYFYHFLNKCNCSYKEFQFGKEEETWLKAQEKLTKLALKNLEKYLHIKKEENITYGTVIGSYEYRNNFAEFLRANHPELDIMILLAYQNKTVSFRSLKNIPVEPLAREYGGNGHEKAAACPLTSETEMQLIKRFIG